jgi:hypothetical protein
MDLLHRHAMPCRALALPPVGLMRSLLTVTGPVLTWYSFGVVQLYDEMPFLYGNRGRDEMLTSLCRIFFPAPSFKKRKARPDQTTHFL